MSHQTTAPASQTFSQNNLFQTPFLLVRWINCQCSEARAWCLEVVSPTIPVSFHTICLRFSPSKCILSLPSPVSELLLDWLMQLSNTCDEVRLIEGWGLCNTPSIALLWDRQNSRMKQEPALTPVLMGLTAGNFPAVVTVSLSFLQNLFLLQNIIVSSITLCSSKFHNLSCSLLLQGENL